MKAKLVIVPLLISGLAFLYSERGWPLAGPAGLGYSYSDQWEHHVRIYYTNELNDAQALNITSGFGGAQFYLALNWGWQIGPYQRLKVSASHLGQKVFFDFAGESAKDWTGQDVLSAAFDKVFPGYDMTATAKAYVGRARDDDFGDVTQADGTLVERKLSGALLNGVSLRAHKQLADFGRLSTGLLYDRLNYTMENELHPSHDGLGLELGYSKSLRPFTVYASSEWRSPFDRYRAGLSYVFCHTEQKPTLKIVGQFEYIEPELDFSHEQRTGVTLTYFWDRREQSRDHIALNNWTQEPAEEIPEVYIVRDQKIH